MYGPLNFNNATRAAAALLALAILVTAAPAGAAELARDHIVLKSAIAVDPQRNTVVLPVYKGQFGSTDVYYILADRPTNRRRQPLGSTTRRRFLQLSRNRAKVRRLRCTSQAPRNSAQIASMSPAQPAFRPPKLRRDPLPMRATRHSSSWRMAACSMRRSWRLGRRHST